VIGYLAQDYGFGPALVYISAVALMARSLTSCWWAM
jgi:hypothetical protein